MEEGEDPRKETEVRTQLHPTEVFFHKKKGILGLLLSVWRRVDAPSAN